MGSNVNNNSPGKFETSVLKVIAGVTQVIPATSSLVINGSSVTQKQILAQLQNIADEYQAARDAKSAYTAALQSKRSDAAANKEYMLQLHAAIVAYFGRQNPQLVQFGYTPTKTVKLTGAEIVSKTAKAAATRGLRNTLGSKQKQAVKATSTPDVTVSNGKASLASPTAPAAPAAPASNTAANAAPATSSSSGAPATSTATGTSSTPASPAGSGTPSGS
jgi:hypothetical protein